MTDWNNPTLEEAHLFFAKKVFNETWDLLEKQGRSREENELMLQAAFASAYHWQKAGTGLHQQRAEWLIARVYTVLGLSDEAIRHAQNCLELTNQYADLMQDFDRAFAFEAAARANALAGNMDLAREFHQQAENAGQEIHDNEDRKIFLDDFNTGNWYGMAN